MALELAQLEAQARVVEDNRHRQGHQRLERRPEQVLRVDIRRQCARDEAGRQQHDEGGNAQPAGQYLRAAREQENQAHSDEDLVCRHAGLR